MVPSFARPSVVLFAVLASAGCTVHDIERPSLSGPSATALSLNLTASPDSLSQDGSARSTISILAIGPKGQPKASQGLRVEMRANGVPQDFGTLSARTLVTNNDGVASVVYTAPSTPAGGVFGLCGSVVGTCVDIVATPIGVANETALSQSVQIRLVPLGVILPPGSTPVAAFQYSPSAPIIEQMITFDASGTTSSDPIVSYSWNFGDGTTASGMTVTHAFPNVASYSVMLTVTTDRGVSASKPLVVDVAASAPPAGTAVFSPAAPRVGTIVIFTNTSVPVAGRQNVAFDWDFGDGAAVAHGASTSHVYTTAGTYTVVFTVTDDIGQKSIKTISVPILP